MSSRRQPDSTSAAGNLSMTQPLALREEDKFGGSSLLRHLSAGRLAYDALVARDPTLAGPHPWDRLTSYLPG